MRFTHREHWLITAITTIALVWVSYAFALRPAIERINTLKRVIPENEKKLEELKIKSEQYLALSKALGNVKNIKIQNQKDFELVAFLESNCKDSGLAKKVVTMKQEVLPVDSKYSEIVAEIQLENITLQQLVEFLLKADSPNQPLWVKSLYITKADTGGLFGVVLQLSSFKLNPA
jgi:type II secretory pathway component PulM